MLVLFDTSSSTENVSHSVVIESCDKSNALISNSCLGLQLLATNMENVPLQQTPDIGMRPVNHLSACKLLELWDMMLCSVSVHLFWRSLIFYSSFRPSSKRFIKFSFLTLRGKHVERREINKILTHAVSFRTLTVKQMQVLWFQLHPLVWNINFKSKGKCCLLTLSVSLTRGLNPNLTWCKDSLFVICTSYSPDAFLIRNSFAFQVIMIICERHEGWLCF